jgi:hypothetical protein
MVIAEDGTRFLVRKTPFRQIFEVPEYRFDDIRVGDRVLDIGANAGAFCIRAARKARSVTAVEPVTSALLVDNIRENNAVIRVIEAGLGDGNPGLCTWDDRSVRVPTFTLTALTGMAGGCDFLKCDCEGAEWGIRPS